MTTATIARLSVIDQIFGANKAPMVAVLSADFSALVAEVTEFTTECEALPAKVQSDSQQIAIGKVITRARDIWKRIEGIRTTEGRPLIEAKRELDEWFKTIGTRLDAATGPLQRAADDYARQVAAEARAKAQREAEEARAKAEKERQRAEAAKSPEAAGNAEARAERLDAVADRAAETATSSAADLTRLRADGVTSSAKETWTFSIDDYTAAVSPLGALGPYFKRADLEGALTSMVRIQKSGAAWPGVRFYTVTKASFR